MNQISKIKNQKFYFDENHLDYLLKRWNKTPGKKIIHLFDLPDYITVRKLTKLVAEEKTQRDIDRQKEIQELKQKVEKK